MKKGLLLILLAGISAYCWCQVSFEKGYYIDNSEEKIDCLIKNVDWKSNPADFQYKSTENDAIKKADIKDAKEFGIYGFSKYVRATVNVDKSGDKIHNLTQTKNPVFTERELFLCVLVEGKANLYLYEDSELTRFFFNIDNSGIEQLIYKRYKETDWEIKQNNYYKQQLWKQLKCLAAKTAEFEKLDYKKKRLIQLFEDYNKCENADFVNYEKQKKRDLFNLTVRPRLNNSSLTFTEYFPSGRSEHVDFEDRLNFGIGIDTEIILPFNRNKWAISIEPTYQHFKSKTKVTFGYYWEVDYKSIELPLGLRHYFYLNNISKIFANVSYVVDFKINPSVDLKRIENNSTAHSLNTGIQQNWAFGVGYKFDRYSVEMRYNTNRNILENYINRSSNYNAMSLVFGYSIF